MRQRLRSHLTYANVVSTLAIFLILGGGTALGAYVVSSNGQIGPGTVSGHKPPAGKHANIIPGSINGQDVAADSLGGGKINESSLGTVPNADRLDGIDSTGLVQTTDGPGGDLYGEFSNMQIAGGAVGTSELSSSIPAVRATRTGNQTISNNNFTALALDTEQYDTAAMHDNTTNNNRLTAPVTGIYLITAHLDWAYQVQGTRELTVMKSGSVLADSGPYFGPGPEELTTQARITAGDWVELQAYQNGGGNLDVLGNASYHRLEFSMTWVAPGP